MQELGIYKDFDLRGVLKAYIGLVWVRRFNNAGDFTLTLAATKANIELIKSGNIIVKGNEAAWIENIESTQESDGRITFAVTGRFLNKMLEDRVVTLSVNGNTSTAIDTILRQFFTEPADPNLKIDNFIIKNTTLQNAVQVKEDWEGKSALECIRDLTQKAIVGFKVDFNLADKTFDFSLYEGRRTLAVFTEEYRNVLTQDYTYLTKDYKNMCYLKHNGTVHVFGGENKGIKRREIYASSNSSSGESLADQAQTILNNHAIVENLDTVVNSENEQYIYKQAWDLGDIVTNHSSFWGVTIEKNVLEVTEYYEMGGSSLALVFGDVPNFAIERTVL